MNTPYTIPTGGPFIYRPTCGPVPYKQPVMEFLELVSYKQESRYYQWFTLLPEREKDRRWRELGKFVKQQLDNERSGSILDA